MDYLPNCFWQSASVPHVLGSLVVVLRRPLRQFASRLRIFPQFAPLALGCRSEMSASTAKTSIASTRAGFFLYDAEWTKRSSAAGADQNPVGRLVLEAPFTSAVDVGAQHY